MNEKQLRQLFSSLVSMQTVDFIQKYIKPKEGDEQFYYANYNMYDAI